MLRGLASFCFVALLLHAEARPQGGEASGNVGVGNALSEQDWNQIARGQIQQAQVILRREFCMEMAMVTMTNCRFRTGLLA